MPDPIPQAALVVAHPGHELRVYGWLETARPRVFVLTDGSGRSQESRAASTEALLSAVGATPGAIFARFTDSDLYAAILDHDFDLFANLADELADAFASSGTELVVGDATEGYNPAHDACRLLIDTAVALVHGTHNSRIDNFEFTLIGRPDECAEESRAEARWLELRDDSFARKLEAARRYHGLAAEVEAALSGNGSVGLRAHPEIAAKSGLNNYAATDETFRVECLRRVTPSRSRVEFVGLPFYEHYGEQKVATGHYSRVLRYREHMLPLAEALHSHVERRTT